MSSSKDMPQNTILPVVEKSKNVGPQLTFRLPMSTDLFGIYDTKLPKIVTFPCLVTFCYTDFGYHS